MPEGATQPNERTSPGFWRQVRVRSRHAISGATVCLIPGMVLASILLPSLPDTGRTYVLLLLVVQGSALLGAFVYAFVDLVAWVCERAWLCATVLGASSSTVFLCVVLEIGEGTNSPHLSRSLPKLFPFVYLGVFLGLSVLVTVAFVGCLALPGARAHAAKLWDALLVPQSDRPRN